VLKLENIRKIFNQGTVNEKTALDGLSLHLKKGEFLTVVGGNGSGKTTMLNAVAGIFPVDSGRISIGGKDITALPEYKRAKYLGRVFQDPMVGSAANMNIDENLALAYRRGSRRGLKWCVTKKERGLYRDMLAQLELGLEDRMASKVGLLSGGQRQALTLLMATLQKPDLLLLDEHTAALDPKTADKVLRLTESLIRENGFTALMVTHNMHDAIKYGNRLIMMEDGKIIFESEGEEKGSLTINDMLSKFSVIYI
jgi:putative ABC transport system ATP-binding protein